MQGNREVNWTVLWPAWESHTTLLFSEMVFGKSCSQTKSVSGIEKRKWNSYYQFCLLNDCVIHVLMNLLICDFVSVSLKMSLSHACCYINRNKYLQSVSEWIDILTRSAIHLFHSGILQNISLSFMYLYHPFWLPEDCCHCQRCLNLNPSRPFWYPIYTVRFWNIVEPMKDTSFLLYFTIHASWISLSMNLINHRRMLMYAIFPFK